MRKIVDLHLSLWSQLSLSVLHPQSVKPGLGLSPLSMAQCRTPLSLLLAVITNKARARWQQGMEKWKWKWRGENHCRLQLQS